MIVQPDFLSHWKTRKLCTRLKDKCAPLYVIRLWSFCQTSKRDVVPADHETIAAICEYEGESKQLLSALTDCGFIEPEKNSEHVIHGWAELNQRLIHNWTVGMNGGRPKVHKEKPKDNPRVSQTEPIRLDKIRVDEIRDTQSAIDPFAIFIGAGEKPEGAISKDEIRTYAGAVKFLRRHKSFLKISDMAIETALKGLRGFQQEWPAMLKQFLVDWIEQDIPEPTKKLRIHCENYAQRKNLSPHHS